MKKVGIVMGSDSDLPVIQKAADTLRTLEVPFEVHVYSAQRRRRLGSLPVQLKRRASVF